LDINKLEYQNQTIRLKYIYHKFFLDTDDLSFLTAISMSNRSNIVADIKNLYLKKYHTYIKGKLNINLSQNLINFDGSFDTHGLKGYVKLTLDNNILNYYVYDTSAKSIAVFMDDLNTKIKINREISNWIYRYIVAKKYKLHYIFGKINIKTGEFYPKQIQAEALANDVSIKFHKNLKSVFAPEVDIKLKNDTLSFKLFKPTYENIDLNGSKVTITNLVSKGSAIEVIIKVKHPLDKKVKKILKAYRVNIPLYQKTSSTDAMIRLYMPFNPFSFHIKGHFYTTNSDIYFKGIKFHTKKAKITLKDNTIKLNKTDISYKNLFEIKTSGIFDTHKNQYKGNLDINKLYLKYKNEVILDSNKTQSSIDIDFKKGSINLKDLNSTLIFGKKNRFVFDNLSNLYTLSPLLKRYNIHAGQAKLFTTNFITFYLKGKIPYNNKILLYNNKPIKLFDINSAITSNDIKLDVNNGIMKANIANKITINTNNISYNLKNTLDKSQNSTVVFKKSITLNAINSMIYIDKEITIPTNTFTFFSNKNKKIFSSIYGKNHIFYSKDSKTVDIQTNFLDADYINNIIHHKLFQNGFFKLSIKESNGLFWGNCQIINSKIKSPKKGGSNFKIDTGKFKFYLEKHILTLTNIVLKNKFSTLKGDGYIDLKKKNLNLVFKVDIFKNLGKTIKSIPLIGYVLLGKDGKFSSKVTISGDFNNPQIKTDFSKDIISSPLNIIFRTIKLPFKLLLPKEK